MAGGIFVLILGGVQMIHVRVHKNGIEMYGHAECSVNGQDIVCAAISALTCSLINSLSDLAMENIRQETGSGMTVIAWQKLTDKGKLLVDSWYLALLDINREYNCIKFI
jgi:uncharacterized protein YsxB (DUF464 family)